MATATIKGFANAQNTGRPLFAVLVLWPAAFSLLEISWLSSVVVTASIVVLCIFGRDVTERLVGASFGPGVGLVVGGGVFVFVGQILRLSGLNRHASYWIPLGMMVLLIAMRSLSSPLPESSKNSRYVQESLYVLSIGLVVLAIGHLWLVPFALSVAMCDWVLRKSNRGPLLVALISGGACLAWLVSSQLRQEKWWYLYQSNDAQFFESLSWSIARWTIFDHPGLVGGSITDYHWFSYAFFGSLSSVAQLGPWDALMKVGVLLLPALFASCLVHTSEQLPESFTIRWVAVILGTIAMEAIRSDSLVFSTVVLLGFLVVVVEVRGRAATKGQVMLFLLLSAILVFSKVSTAVVGGLILALLMVISTKRGERVNWIPITTLFAVSVVAYLVSFRGNDPELIADLNISVNRSVNELFDFLEPRLLINVVLCGVVLLVFVRGRRLRDFDSLSLAVVAAATLGLFIHLLLAGRNTRYFVLPAIWFIAVIIVWKLIAELLPTSARSTKLQRTLAPSCLSVGILVGYLSPRVLRRLDSLLDIEGSVESFVWKIVTTTGPMLTLIVLMPVLYAVASHYRTLVLVLLAALGIFVGQSGEQYVKLRHWGPSIYELEDPSVTVFGTDELADVGRYIRENTSENVILASNHFCCFGESWQISGHSDSEFKHVSVGKAPTLTSLGGSNYLLPAYTERRFLVQGLGFQVRSGVESLAGDPFRRLRVSLEFANRPSLRSVNDLKSYDVTGFIVSLALTDVRDWSRFAYERYRAGEFVYLELK